MTRRDDRAEGHQVDDVAGAGTAPRIGVLAFALGGVSLVAYLASSHGIRNFIAYLVSAAEKLRGGVG